MKEQTGNLLAGAVLGGVAGILVSVFGINLITGERAPQLAGQEVPAALYRIDFSKRYHLILDANSVVSVYSNCLIKGITGDDKTSSRGYYFDTWLAVERPNGLMAFIPFRSIRMIEEVNASTGQ